MRLGVIIGCFIFLSASFVACKKVIFNPLGINGNCKTAILVAQDLRKCACCGGFFIDVDGQRFLTQTDLGVLNNDFADGKITFPQEVQICFKQAKNRCGNDGLIDILKITK